MKQTNKQNGTVVERRRRRRKKSDAGTNERPLTAIKLVGVGFFPRDGDWWSWKLTWSSRLQKTQREEKLSPFLQRGGQPPAGQLTGVWGFFSLFFYIAWLDFFFF